MGRIYVVSSTAYWTYINHSCAPNCQLDEVLVDEKPRLKIVSLVDIEKGQPITIDYGNYHYGKTIK
jgi:SET domain-containing protein